MSARVGDDAAAAAVDRRQRCRWMAVVVESCLTRDGRWERKWMDDGGGDDMDGWVCLVTGTAGAAGLRGARVLLRLLACCFLLRAGRIGVAGRRGNSKNNE